MSVVNEIQDGIKAFGEIAVKPLLAIALGSAFLLFGPASMLGAAGLTNHVNEYRAWIGGTFTLSCAYLLAHAIKYLADSVKSWSGARSLDKRRKKWLISLTPDEKGCLVPYIRDQRASVRIRSGTEWSVACRVKAFSIALRASGI